MMQAVSIAVSSRLINDWLRGGAGLLLKIALALTL